MYEKTIFGNNVKNGGNMIKKFIKFLFVLLCIFAMIFSVSGCSTQKTEEEELMEKNLSEIEYLDNYIILMLNSINDIDLKQYDAKIERTENLNEVINTDEEISSEDSGNNIVQYMMIPNMILNSDHMTNWEGLKIEIENLNNIWPSIIVDFYKANIDNNKLIEFSNEINTCTKNIKEENRAETLNSLVKLYDYIPFFLEKIDNNKAKIGITKTKANVLRGYADIDLEQWDELNQNLDNAISDYDVVVNNIDVSEKEYNVDKAYVLLQELKNACETKDKELLFMKYKNLMEELIIL